MESWGSTEVHAFLETAQGTFIHPSTHCLYHLSIAGHVWTGAALIESIICASVIICYLVCLHHCTVRKKDKQLYWERFHLQFFYSVTSLERWIRFPPSQTSVISEEPLPENTSKHSKQKPTGTWTVFSQSQITAAGESFLTSAEKQYNYSWCAFLFTACTTRLLKYLHAAPFISHFHTILHIMYIVLNVLCILPLLGSNVVTVHYDLYLRGCID